MAGLHSSNYRRQATSGEESRMVEQTRGSLVLVTLVIHRQAELFPGVLFYSGRNFMEEEPRWVQMGTAVYLITAVV